MNRMRSLADRLRERYGKRRINWYFTAFLIGLGVIGVHLLTRYGLGASALLYVGLPYLGALVIAIMQPIRFDRGVGYAYWDMMLTAVVVLLVISLILGEGFLCFLFFLPIYVIVVSLAFASRWVDARDRDGYGKRLGAFLPVLVLGSSFEGTTETLTFERSAYVQASRVAELTPEQVMENLLRPIELRRQRHWLLEIFPMPYEVQADSVEPGAVHRMYTRYHRWFVTNTHEGEQHLEIVDFEPHRLTTRVVHDTTFFSTYLAQTGSEVLLTPVAPNRTEISLRLDYRRKLDPAWYFHPLQQFAMRQMAAFFIDEVLARDAPALRPPPAGSA